MSAPAIEVSGLGKRYVIEHESRHDSLRDTLHHTARKLWRRYRWGTSFEKEEFWALRDVSFAVQPGEVVGILGRNGAGKSTLLKILSRITEPTTGRITLRGRVASLLEVGTGFHPDLTGRENIYLNGAILGMSRAEIRAKFDEIVAFAEVERFLDTPVKRYSSGMYVRLAFAVAAHLEPEILIVDEVLAVGDAQFQRKCLGKMREVAQGSGRTVIFVSHNLGALQALCTRAVVLSGGRVVGEGDVATQLALYSASSSSIAAGAFQPRAASPHLTLQSLELEPDTAVSGSGLGFALELTATRSVTVTEACLIINSPTGSRIAIADLRRPGTDWRLGPGCPLRLGARIRQLPLVEGEYVLALYLNSSEFCGDLNDLRLMAVQSRPVPTGVTPYASQYRGCVELELEP
jgi:lipopolysaccharide transport system ATP-binding protein